MDNTGSMGSYIKKAKDCINRIIDEFVKKFENSELI